MPELNFVSTSPAVDPNGAAGQVLQPYYTDAVPGYNYGGANNPTGTGFMEFGSGTPGSLPFRVDQAGNVTSAGFSNLLPTGDTSGAKDAAAIQAILTANKPAILGSGTFYINAALAMKTGGYLAGAGMGQTLINQVSTTAHGISALDASQLTIRDLLIGGPAAGSGNGINLAASVNSNVAYVDIENVVAGSFGNIGVHIDTAIVTHLRKVIASSNAGDGFQFSNTKGTPTSVSLDSCYANGNGASGYEFDGAAYCALNGCASDGNVNGYAFFSCQGITLNGCGTERFTGAGWIFDACNGCHLNGARTFSGKTVVVHVTDGTKNQTITGLVETSPASGATSSILTDSGTSSVIINPTVVTAASYATGTAYVITGTGGTVH